MEPTVQSIPFAEHPTIKNVIQVAAERMGKPVEEVSEVLHAFSDTLLNYTMNDIDAALYFIMSALRVGDHSEEALTVIAGIRLRKQADLLTKIFMDNPEMINANVKLLAIPEPADEAEAMSVVSQITANLCEPFYKKG